MDCKLAEKNISGFLKYTLFGNDLRLFLEHIDNCPHCKEELGTSYLLDVALERIEEGETVKLDQELDERVNAAKKALLLHIIFSNIFRSIEVIAGIILSFGLVRSFVIYILPRIAG